MEFKEIIEKAHHVRTLYAELEKKEYGRSWNINELTQGFVGDVGDLNKIITAKEGMRGIENTDEKLAHELSDCLWSLLSIAQHYDIDLEKEFSKTMTELEERVKNESH